MKPDLTALVSSRICHDLISPIGAISNGVELMTELGSGLSPELALIGDSVSSAAGKVRYFRIAFGAARADAQVSVAEVRQVVDAMFTGRSKAVLQADEANLPRQTAKMLLLTLLCVEKSLPLGGQIDISVSAGGYSIAIAADRIAAVPEKWALLTGEAADDDVAASDVQFLLLRDELARTGTRLDQEFSETGAQVQMSGLRPAA